MTLPLWQCAPFPLTVAPFPHSNLAVCLLPFAICPSSFGSVPLPLPLPCISPVNLPWQILDQHRGSSWEGCLGDAVYAVTSSVNIIIKQESRGSQKNQWFSHPTSFYHSILQFKTPIATPQDPAPTYLFHSFTPIILKTFFNSAVLVFEMLLIVECTLTLR